MADKDVTELVDFGANDDEALPLTKCVCGKKYDLWDTSIGIYRDWARGCPDCGRKLYFTCKIRVYEVEED